MKKVLLISILAFSAASLNAQQPQHFYNKDTEITLEGRVERIILEPRYEGASKFLILVVRSSRGQDYICEVSPSWFFSKDFHKGEHLNITGSSYQGEGGAAHLIVRQIRFQGELMVFRDKNGFPNWRGGKGKAQPKRRRKRF